MDRLQQIESRRFLGREFLVWMWFESELFEAQMSVQSVGSFELLLEKQIKLESGGKKDREQCQLRGANPASGPEAREALRQGKTPTTASMKLRRGEQEFAFVFQADMFTIAAVKLPSLLNEKDDEPFYERIALLEDVENHVEALYNEFCLLRSGDAWDKVVMPTLLRWVNDEEIASPDPYRKARNEAVAAAQGKAKPRKKAA